MKAVCKSCINISKQFKWIQQSKIFDASKFYQIKNMKNLRINQIKN